MSNIKLDSINDYFSTKGGINKIPIEQINQIVENSEESSKEVEHFIKDEYNFFGCKNESLFVNLEVEEMKLLKNLGDLLNLQNESKQKIAELNIELENGKIETIPYFYGDNIDIIIDEFTDFHKISKEVKPYFKFFLKNKILLAIQQYINKLKLFFDHNLIPIPS